VCRDYHVLAAFASRNPDNDTLNHFNMSFKAGIMNHKFAVILLMNKAHLFTSELLQYGHTLTKIFALMGYYTAEIGS
jgi:hypothetical protein